MADLGFMCWGAGGWYTSEIDPERPGEDLEAEYDVPNEVVDEPDAVRQGAELTKAFIKSGMKERDMFVDVSFDVPQDWRKAIRQAWGMTEGPTSALHLPPLNGLTTDDVSDTSTVP